MYGFIAQLVEHRTGIAEVTGSNHSDECVFIYRTYHIMNHGGLQFYFE